jgi:hypothetical protein
MKKILAALALLALVFGTVAAQDGELTVKGHVKTGFEIDADEGIIAPYNDDAGRKFQAQVQFDYVTENSGVSVRLRADERSLNIPRPDNGHAYGWFNFLPGGIAQISGGILGNMKFGTFTDFFINDGIDNRGYFKLAVTPIEGLTIGLTTIAIDPTVGVSDLKDAFKGTVVGAKYVVPDTFGISAAFMFNKAESNFRRLRMDQGGYDLGSGGVGYAYGTFSTLVSAFYYGVENLKLDLDAYFGTDKDTEASTLGIGLQGNYQIMEPLFAGARVVFETQPQKEDAPAVLQIRPQAGYTVNDWLEFGLEIPITIDNTERGTALNYGVGTGKKGLEDATMIIGVAPKATFTLNSNTKLAAWYTLNVLSPKDGDSELKNTVNLDLIWTF